MVTGDGAMHCLSAFAQEHHLSAARFTGLGAFSEVLLGFFVPEEKDYRRISVREQVEVASLIGDIALAGSEPRSTPTWSSRRRMAAHGVVICWRGTCDRPLKCCSSNRPRTFTASTTPRPDCRSLRCDLMDADDALRRIGAHC